MKLYGHIFYNRRPAALDPEELFYNRLELTDTVIIEAGAHFGVYSLFFSKRIRNGTLYAFEPNPLSFYFLSKNIRANRCDNVVPINAGLSDRPDRLRLVARRYRRSTGTLLKERQESIERSGEPLVEADVPVTTVDDFVRERQLKRLDFVKIDTEGFEPSVVRGMAETLRILKPVMLFEVHGLTTDQQNHSLRQIYSTLSSCGYRTTKLCPGLPEVSALNLAEFAGGGYVAYAEPALGVEQALRDSQQLNATSKAS